MGDKRFSKSMKLADMIHTDYRLLYVLPRFGIRLGFGDTTVADICAKSGVDADVFVLICNIYAFDDLLPKLHEMDHVSLAGIMSYLKQSHTDYLHKRIPHIVTHIESLAEEAQERQRDIIRQFCESYKKEVVEHFDYEEETVFPYIESLIAGAPDQRYTIHEFLENHTNIDDKLHDLKNIIMKYVHTSDEDAQRDLLIDVYMLEDDLERHTTIEEKILAALAETIERRKQNPQT